MLTKVGNHKYARWRGFVIRANTFNHQSLKSIFIIYWISTFAQIFLSK